MGEDLSAIQLAYSILPRVWGPLSVPLQATADGGAGLEVQGGAPGLLPPSLDRTRLLSLPLSPRPGSRLASSTPRVGNGPRLLRDGRTAWSMKVSVRPASCLSLSHATDSSKGTLPRPWPERDGAGEALGHRPLSKGRGIRGRPAAGSGCVRPQTEEDPPDSGGSAPPTTAGARLSPAPVTVPWAAVPQDAVLVPYLQARGLRAPSAREWMQGWTPGLFPPQPSPQTHGRPCPLLCLLRPHQPLTS